MRRVTLRGAVRHARALQHRRARERARTAAEANPDAFAAGYRAWTRKRSNKLRGAIPDPWGGAEALVGPFPRVAVVVHAYYDELVSELAERVASLPVGCDVLITDATRDGVDSSNFAGENVRQVRVYPVANHGRDIWPLVQLVNAGLLDPYEIVLKVHTKKSEWRAEHAELDGDGDRWKDEFLTSLAGSPSVVAAIMTEFDERPALGLLTAPGNILGAEFWGGDQEIAHHLLLRLRLHLPEHQLQFAAGSMYWIRAFVLQGLRALELTADDFEPEQGQIDGTTAHALERLIGMLAGEAGYVLDTAPTLAEAGVETERPVTDVSNAQAATAVAFYLPQFHTFPENDGWWGRGFTEWSNVASALPVFPGHSQPLLPSDLGFYDLADARVLPRQIDEAHSAGIGAFMYYYYWFAGKSLMDDPVRRHLDDDIDFPFCLMWANENWTRRWDGGSKSVLIEQEHESVSPTEFIKDVMDYLVDPRYLRIDGKPVLAVYKLSQLPDAAGVVRDWRAEAIKAGLPGLTVLSVDVGAVMDGISASNDTVGVDGFMEFAPHNLPWAAHDISDLDVDPRFEGNIMDYRAMANATLATRAVGVPDGRYPGVMVNFDNTARRQWQSDLWLGSNPYTFRRWLRGTVDAMANRTPDHRIVFVNAWNEWAECAVLEPTQRFGRTFLLAARDALG